MNNGSKEAFRGPGMTTTNTTIEAFDEAPRPKATGFVVLTILALALGAGVIYYARTAATPAPLTSPYPEDWLNWARTETLYSGLLLVAAVFLVMGLVGMMVRAMTPRRPAQRLHPVTPSSRPVTDDRLAVAAAAPAAKPEIGDEPVPTLFGEPPSVEVRSLEPAVFHDNASDSFLSQTPAASAVSPVEDAFSATHGLQVHSGAQVIPIRPDVTIGGNDPVEAALLSEPAAEPSPAPQSDMSAVIASARHFAAPEAASEPAPVVATPAPVEAPAAVDAQGEISQAVQMALSVWPDATRAIASDELRVRVSHLYYDKAPESVRAFHLIETGDLSAAAAALQAHADALTQSGRNAEAAEQWRIYGALHMGRDDAKAMTAYEKVSELDPSDANIHLYLARRYQMAGETGKMLPVLGRALGVISDPQTRAELLTPYADLKMKAGDTRAAGDAFEELSRLHETSAALRPDDVAARSTHAITLARLAQAREMHGAYDQAGPLYKKAYDAFATLSAQKPDHAGLRAMADNALKDAQRFNQA